MLILIFSINSSLLSKEENLASGVYSVTAIALGRKKNKIRKLTIDLEDDSAGCELSTYPLVEADSSFLQSLFHFDISLMYDL